MVFALLNVTLVILAFIATLKIVAVAKFKAKVPPETRGLATVSLYARRFTKPAKVLVANVETPPRVNTLLPGVKLISGSVLICKLPDCAFTNVGYKTALAESMLTLTLDGVIPVAPVSPVAPVGPVNPAPAGPVGPRSP
jgi:hypothetical protein